MKHKLEQENESLKKKLIGSLSNAEEKGTNTDPNSYRFRMIPIQLSEDIEVVDDYECNYLNLVL